MAEAAADPADGALPRAPAGVLPWPSPSAAGGANVENIGTDGVGVGSRAVAAMPAGSGCAM